MIPKITFKCLNEKCEQHAKELEGHYSPFFTGVKEERGEDHLTARIKRCRSCYMTGEVKIKHGSRTFSDIEAFEEYVVGVAKEARLLKKLIVRGVAEAEEKEQFDESMKLLQNVVCPCCGQPLHETVSTRVEAQPSAASDADKPHA
ncbi:MAG: hypothetical protein KJ921_17775 [Proteobacteria bacterium]|nr:hypothetical protein [Pseudomonadota bacterium]